MTMPVDLTNLRSITDGDAEIENALFYEFYESFEAGIKALQTNTGESSTEAWRKEAHALKGVALNLGAMKLGELCKKGQDEPKAGADTKQLLLKYIQDEYEQVRKYLVTLHQV